LAEKEKLKEQLANVNNPEVIEEEARKQLKLIMPGETLYILKDDSNED
jgi:cell division protein DivIC